MLDALEQQSAPSTIANRTRHAAPAEMSTAVHTTIRAMLLVVAALAAIELMGFLTSGIFAEAFHVEDAAFRPDLLTDFRYGAKALLPFAIYWVGGITVVGILAALVRLCDPFGKRMAPLLHGAATIQPSLLAAAVLCTGTLFWAITLWAYWDVFDVIVALQSQANDASPFSLIGRSFRLRHVDFSSIAAWLSFALLFTVVRLFPWLERRAHDVVLIRGLRWATLALTVLVIVSSAAPRRLAWDPFRVVMYARRPGIVIAEGETGLLVLRYPLDPRHPSPIRVDPHDPELMDRTR
jgi:hypothetical protein